MVKVGNVSKEVECKLNVIGEFLEHNVPKITKYESIWKFYELYKIISPYCNKFTKEIYLLQLSMLYSFITVYQSGTMHHNYENTKIKDLLKQITVETELINELEKNIKLMIEGFEKLSFVNKRQTSKQQDS